jgi:WD40 repeat protein
VNSRGQIVYTVASLGIVYDVEDNEQSIFGGGSIPIVKDKKQKDYFHTDEILCLAMNEDRNLVASGQIGSRPYIFVWYALTAKMKTKIRLDKNTKGVSSLCFSLEKPYKIACIDCSYEHNLWIYDMKTRQKQFKISTDSRPKLDIEWGFIDMDNIIAIAGDKNVRFLRGDGDDFTNSELLYGVTDRKHLYDHT